LKISRPALIMGLADGMTTGAGLVLGMSVAHQVRAAIWLAGLSGGLAAFPGMASGRYQSEPADGYLGAAVCGLSTTFGSVLVVLPFVVAAGTAAVVAALCITAVLCAVVAVLREQSGWRAWALSYGITAAAAGLCVLGALLIPS
jgi:VIT1/CCC1 family predicted Fe2+/Mn2+ transporter